MAERARVYLACLVAVWTRGHWRKSRRAWQRSRDVERREQRAIRERRRSGTEVER